MSDSVRPGHGIEHPLGGWKTIAAAVGLASSAARRVAWRRRDPLPVWRYLHMVIAYPSALRDWKARQMLPLPVAQQVEEYENGQRAAHDTHRGPTRLDTREHPPPRRNGK